MQESYSSKKGRQFTAKWWRPNQTVNYQWFNERQAPNRHANRYPGFPRSTAKSSSGAWK